VSDMVGSCNLRHHAVGVVKHLASAHRTALTKVCGAERTARFHWMPVRVSRMTVRSTRDLQLMKKV
jgi:hypothetical protein